MCTKKSECELKTWRRKCIIQSESKSKICLLNLHNRADKGCQGGHVADRIARHGCKNSFSYPYSYCNRGRIRTVLSPLGFGAKAVALFIEKMRTISTFRNTLSVFNKKRWKILLKFELTKPRKGGIITLLSNAAMR